MSYYTDYTLDFEDINDYYFYEAELRKIAGFNPFEIETKWSGWKKDMKELSSKYPNVLFKLYGTGEENSDMWKAYFKNGKMQICKAKITFDKYNENLLK